MKKYTDEQIEEQKKTVYYLSPDPANYPYGLNGWLSIQPSGELAIILCGDAPKNATHFWCGAVLPMTEVSPAWADFFVGNQPVRINPAICRPPLAAMGQCLWMAANWTDRIPFAGGNYMRHEFLFDSRQYVFQRFASGHEKSIVLIDYESRIREWC